MVFFARHINVAKIRLTFYHLDLCAILAQVQKIYLLHHPHLMINENLFTFHNNVKADLRYNYKRSLNRYTVKVKEYSCD